MSTRAIMVAKNLGGKLGYSYGMLLEKSPVPKSLDIITLLDHFLESNRFPHVGQPRSMIQHIEIHKI